MSKTKKRKHDSSKYDSVNKMEFSDIINCLKDGHFATRVSWRDHPQIFMVASSDFPPLIMISGKIKGKQATLKWQSKHEDLLANDWVFIEREARTTEEFPGLDIFSEPTQLFLATAPDDVATDISNNVEQLGVMLKDMRAKELKDATELPPRFEDDEYGFFVWCNENPEKPWSSNAYALGKERQFRGVAEFEDIVAQASKYLIDKACPAELLEAPV